MKRLIAAVASTSILVLGHVAVGCVGDEPPPVTALPDAEASNDSSVAPNAKDNGAACTGASECASGNCTDGVCCDSPCDGTCEKCNLPGSAGRCEAIPDGEDPDTECPTTPLSPNDGGSTAADGGTPFEVPDGGLTPGDDNQCAGKCNGKRACAFAGSERTCGSVFCGSASQQGRASCDGKGHCLYGIEECSAYACPDGSAGCKKTCAGEADCLPTHFCEATTSTCKPKLANGSACSSVAQCQSGNCIDQVCCNDACNILGGTCKAAGSVGSCKCSACSTGPCQLFYRDEDRDGYGDAKGTIANGRAAFGCVNTPPAGFVANKTDCYDDNTAVAASVHPNQVGHYSTPYTPPGGAPSFDYDCVGTETTATPVFLNASCGYCTGAPNPGCPPLKLQCPSAGARASLSCTIGGALLGTCVNDATSGFTAVVPCGQSGQLKTCGTCGGANTAPTVSTTTAVQSCR